MYNNNYNIIYIIYIILYYIYYIHLFRRLYMQACGVTGVTAVTGVMLVGRALSWGMVSLGMPPFFPHVTANSRSDACWWLLGLLRLPHMLFRGTISPESGCFMLFRQNSRFLCSYLDFMQSLFLL